MNTSNSEPKIYQTIILMRHGERVDAFDESWNSKAARPWDPHLIDAGHSRALSSGRNLRIQLGFPIHRVFASPFLRCVETASGVISGLCTNISDGKNHASNSDTTIQPSNIIKASIQYGLCEALNSMAFDEFPKDGKDWGFNLSELETLFPVGTVDRTCDQVDAQLPQWEETTDDANARFIRVIHTLADKYPVENLLLVFHGQGLRNTMRTFLSNVKSCRVDYCGYLQLRREILMMHSNGSFEAGKFELLTDCNYGITYTTLSDEPV